MYSDHVPLLTRHGQTARGLADLATFVLLTIRQQFPRVPDEMKDVRKTGENSRALFAWKLEGYRDLHKPAWEGVAARVLATRKADYAIETLMGAVHGLGIVKAAFVAQMLGHPVACLDSRNLVRLGLSKRAFRAWRGDGYSARAIGRKVTAYVATCERAGGASFLWDAWCTEVGRDYGSTAQQISAMHLAAIANNWQTLEQRNHAAPF